MNYIINLTDLIHVRYHHTNLSLYKSFSHMAYTQETARGYQPTRLNYKTNHWLGTELLEKKKKISFAKSQVTQHIFLFLSTCAIVEAHALNTYTSCAVMNVTKNGSAPFL